MKKLVIREMLPSDFTNPRRDLALAAAYRLADQRKGPAEWPEVAVISEDATRAVVLATKLRRVGITTATYLSGNFRRQMQKAIDADAEYLLIDGRDGLILRDRRDWIDQATTEESYARDALEALIFDWSITSEELCFLEHGGNAK